MNPIELKVKRSYYIRVIFIGLFTLGIGTLLMYLEYRRWARTFDPAGVTRRDGERFLWQDLKEKRRVNMRNLANAPLNHIELIFFGGKAFFFPLMVANGREVLTSIVLLPVRN
jgi:hypothetical protein